MNRAMVRFVTGRILFITGLLMFPSVVVALYYREGWAGVWPFLIPIAIALLLGTALSIRRPKKPDFFMREGLVVVGITWLSLSFLGSLPFVISRSIPSMVDAFFEAASGFTTTGASVLSAPQELLHSQLFWRSFTHLIGGMGILVFALAVMPRIQSDDVFIMKAEVPGPVFGKLLSRVRGTARVLYIMYLAMTAILTLLLVLGGMPLFDSLLHAFGTAGTGGFGIQANSVAYYTNPYIHYVIAFGMLAFGVNFNLYYALLYRRMKGAFKSEEFRWYIGFVAGALVLILLNTRNLYESFSQQLREVFFTISSIMTTTGFTINNYETWPLFSHVILLGLMMIGGMAGSTAGGLKVSRVALYIKSSFQEFRGSLNPNRRLPLRFEGKATGAELKTKVFQYLAIYILLYVAFLLVVAADAGDFMTSFSVVAATFNNIGPGFGAVGPSRSYQELSDLSKVALSFAMIMGRLEIIPIIALLSPRTWRRT